MNKFYLISLSVLFLFTSPAYADINTANEALARGDHAAAAAEFERLAEQGDKKAQANLGYMYYVGEGVPQDYVKAVKWYKKAAILGDRDSQYNLAVAYAFGEGVKQDYKEAFQWYRRAAEQEHAVAQYSLGISYAYGEGVPQNPGLAAEWFKKSAEQGYERAQVLLGSLYHTGEGVEKDYEKAALWYRKAADRGNAAAQYNLGSLYRAGNGVEQDYNQAVRWFRLSADQGYAAAQNELASIERAVAGANRPEPEPVTEPVAKVETTTTESTSTTTTVTTLPTPLPKPSPEVVPEPGSEPAIATDATSEKKSEQGFFSKLFGKKESSDTADQSGVVYATPEQVAADEKTHIPVPVTAPVTAPEIEAIETADSDIDTTVTANEPKQGFFSRLFGKAEPTDLEPTQDGVVFATPEQTKTAENQSLGAPVARSESELNDSENNNDSVTDSTIVLSDEERPEKGFFSKLFGTGETDETATSDTETDQLALNQSATVKTYAADSAPAGQRLESSSANRITETEVIPAETVTQVPEASSESSTETEEDTSVAEVLPEEATTALDETTEADAPKKGFFARLFGKGESDAADAIKTEAADADTADEPLVVAKLESADTEKDEQQLSDDAGISSIDVSPDLENVTSASDIQPFAVRGDATAQFHLGALYYQGKGVKQDYAQAFLWYRRAAQQGNADAQYSLGNMYLMGEGINQDDYEARHWYEKAAMQGHESAQHNLESLQRIATAEPTETDLDAENNLTVQKDNSLADEAEDGGKKRGFFSKLFGGGDESDESDVDEFDETEAVTEYDDTRTTSVDIGNTPKGIYDKGLAYEFGEGVAQSHTAAFELFKQSAEKNYAPAQYKLGVAYAYGQGVEKNPEIAAEWYRKSAEQGYALAQRTLGSMYMGGDGVEQNKSLALAWYDILADSGNVMDVHRRDALKAKLTDDEIAAADVLKQQLSN